MSEEFKQYSVSEEILGEAFGLVILAFKKGDDPWEAGIEVIREKSSRAPAQEGMREALMAAKHFITNGVEFGYIRLPDLKIDPALQTLKKIDLALERAKSVPALSAPAEPAGQTEHLKTIVRDLTKFITSLTPGGSEYLLRFDDDLYFADLITCAPYIRQRIEETHETKKQAAKASKEEPAGRELLEALKIVQVFCWQGDVPPGDVAAALSKLRTALGEK